MRKLAGLVIVLMSVAGCKKTAEGEQRVWEKGTKHVKQLTALYPGFQNALSSQLSQATKTMESSKAISDPKAAVKKMAEANRVFSSGIAGSLDRVDKKIKSLRQKLVDATTGAVDETDRLSAKTVADDAKRVLANVDATLQRGAQDIVGAEAVLKKAIADLSLAEKNVDKVIRVAKNKQRKATAAKKAAAGVAQQAAAAAVGNPQTAVAQPTAPAVAPVAKPPPPWKCAYCGGSNDANSHKCKSCGAAHK